MIERNSGLYMRVDRFKKVESRISQKNRSMTLLSRARIMFMSKRFNIGLFFMLLAAVNFKMCMPDVQAGCIPCMTGETAEVQGVITKVDVKSYGAKSYNGYYIHYTYTVEGKTYSGMAVDSGRGLGYLENHTVVVDYSVKNHACSCARNMECLAQSALFTVITGAVLFFIGLLWILSGIMGISRAAAVLQYGDVVQGTVSGIAEEKKSNPFNLGGVGSFRSKITQYRVTCSFSTAEGKKKTCTLNAKNKDVIQSGDNLTVIYDPDIPENVLVIEALPKSVNTSPELPV
ncbi:MAG TPA: DUF3592 domain-containing protein [Spirochaetota bacterium]|nr:DUF3592 domain-containing protein [Spirochaetota bacterium]